MEKKVLVIEDEENIASLIKDIFALYKKPILHAQFAVEALTFLKENEIDFIVIDISLPDKKGEQLYQEIVSKYPQLDGRFVFMSGFDPSEILAEILSNTTNTFIQKPFHLAEFRKIIENLMKN